MVSPHCLFLVDHVKAEMQAQIIKEAINLLTEARLDVHGVTFDGCSKFENSEETAEYVIKINNMFELLNSKSSFLKHINAVKMINEPSE